jgi:hypothetical protein
LGAVLAKGRLARGCGTIWKYCCGRIGAKSGAVEVEEVEEVKEVADVKDAIRVAPEDGAFGIKVSEVAYG